MKLENIIGKKLSESIKTVRTSNTNYEELVFLAENNSTLHEVLTEKLGPVIKGGNEIEETMMIMAAIETANSNGGIDDDQFLYGGILNSLKIVIMIWPWQDNEHLTIKKFIV